MNQTQDKNEPKIYFDSADFKGNIIKDNINTINKIYFGQGIRITETPFIYRRQSDGKYYLSAFKFSIEQEEGKKSKVFYYPINFLNLTFYHANCLFFLRTIKILDLFKFEKDSYTKYQITQKTPQNNSKITKETLKLDEKLMKEIQNKLSKIGQNLGMKSEYELLCDISGNYLKEELIDRNFKKNTEQKKFEINLDNIKFSCTLEKIEIEIDGVGQIREPMKVQTGSIKFKEGIQSLKQYVLDKKNGINIPIENDFKCPIIFKNFEENIIPQKQTIMCEIKSGFAVEDVVNQLQKRIEIIKECLFDKDEKPIYFIAIINLLSKNVEKLDNLLNYEFEFKERTLIVSAIDFNYHGYDISSELPSEYLLFKKIDNIEKNMNNRFDEINAKLDILLGKKTQI